MSYVLRLCQNNSDLLIVIGFTWTMRRPLGKSHPPRKSSSSTEPTSWAKFSGRSQVCLSSVRKYDDEIIMIEGKI